MKKKYIWKDGNRKKCFYYYEMGVNRKRNKLDNCSTRNLDLSNHLFRARTM